MDACNLHSYDTLEVEQNVETLPNVVTYVLYGNGKNIHTTHVME